MALLIFPCHLGIIFNGFSDEEIFKKIKYHLMNEFESIFYDIINLNEFNIRNDFFSNTIEIIHEDNNLGKEIKVYPTDKFFQILMKEKKKSNLEMIICITEVPIYSSSKKNIFFLFGETYLKCQCCIVSTTKLREEFYNREGNQELFNKRIVKEVIHEIGHLILGIEHCQEHSCVMRFSLKIEEIDKKSIELCNQCKLQLNMLKKKFNLS